MEKYRNELKYVINNYYETFIKKNISNVMSIDKNASSLGYYNIRSIYLDDYNNSFYYENENGYNNREKMRIRIYNGNKNRIMFEIKNKISDKTCKEQCPMTEKQVLDIIDGKRIQYEDDLNPLLKKLYILQSTKHLKPKIIVEYDRIPFVYKDGNVRITLDLNLRSSNQIDCFFGKHINSRPVMPLGENLLEVKYDEFLPRHIYDLLNVTSLQQTSFSKYYLCRKFGGIVI